jgi:hypothetical protein
MVLEAVVELSEEFVEEVSGGGGVAVAVFAPLAVMLARGLIGGGGRERTTSIRRWPVDCS